VSAKPAVPGDGSIFPYKGKWAAFVWVVTPTGEKSRKWLYGDTREDVEPTYNELKVQAAKVPIPTGTPTVEEFLTTGLKMSSSRTVRTTLTRVTSCPHGCTSFPESGRRR